MIENINFGREIAFGLLIGFVFIVLNAYFGFIIGIPQYAFSSDSEKYIVQDVVAPLAEESGFRIILPFLLLALGIPLIIVGVIDIISFVGYHFYAYGSNLAAASSLFIGAGLFAFIAFAITYYDSDENAIQVPIAAIIAHMLINTYLGIKAAGLVIVG